MAGEKFKLNFITNGEGIKEIQEPIGFDAVDFTLRQDNKRLGRDVSFAGGESEFTFSPLLNHEFDLLIYYYETFGWESEVQLIVEVDGFDNIIGDFDFFNAKTNLFDYFTCEVVQVKKQALIKKRNDVKVNLYSNLTVDDDPIQPVETNNILVRAKPTLQVSTWETTEPFAKTFTVDAGQFTDDTEHFVINPINLVKFDVDDSLQLFEKFKRFEKRSRLYGYIDQEFYIVNALNNLSNIKVNITNVDINLFAVVLFGRGNADYTFGLRYGRDFNTAERVVFFNGRLESNQSFTTNENYSQTIPFLNRADKIWLYLEERISASGNILNGAAIQVINTINSMDVEITATSTAYSTIAPSVNLHDAVEYTVGSISRLPIVFPFANTGGEMANQRLLNGNMLRGITDKPFYMSMKDIEKWLPEIYGDYEVTDFSVFFGLYKDYYTNIECGVFDTVKFDDYEKSLNEKLAINQFNYKYEKFQSQKEQGAFNTYDVVHGESEWLVPNVFVENKKEVSVGFVRDSFLISETQKSGLTKPENETSQDDDTVFIIDSRPSAFDFKFVETDFLQHTFNNDNYTLKLSNTGNFNFSLIGIRVDDTFLIANNDKNAGNYRVVEVNSNFIVLSPIFTIISASGDGERVTQFTYTVTKETAPFFSWGSQGFTNIDNILSSRDYANLRYSIKRNIIRFYNQYLASCKIWSKKLIKNTFYKNNPDAILTYEGITTREAESFDVSDPIINAYKHTIKIITDFATYKNLENRIRADRGYIRIVDNDEFILKLYPIEMTFVNSGDLGELTIIGEEKYETSLINITYNELPYLTINDNYRTTKLIYKEKRNKFYIFDENGKLLLKPTFWHKITINNGNAKSREQLIEWLTLIS